MDDHGEVWGLPIRSAVKIGSVVQLITIIIAGSTAIIILCGVDWQNRCSLLRNNDTTAGRINVSSAEATEEALMTSMGDNNNNRSINNLQNDDDTVVANLTRVCSTETASTRLEILCYCQLTVLVVWLLTILLQQLSLRNARSDFILINLLANGAGYVTPLPNLICLVLEIKEAGNYYYSTQETAILYIALVIQIALLLMCSTTVSITHKWHSYVELHYGVRCMCCSRRFEEELAVNQHLRQRNQVNEAIELRNGTGNTDFIRDNFVV